MERATHQRVVSALLGERVMHEADVQIVMPFVGPETWKLVGTQGRNAGGNPGGRILLTLGGTDDPLAGLVWFVERGQPFVSHVWVDPDVRGIGLSRLLFDAYRATVTPSLVVVGPFTPGGRAAATAAGAVLLD